MGTIGMVGGTPTIVSLSLANSSSCFLFDKKPSLSLPAIRGYNYSKVAQASSLVWATQLRNVAH